MTASSPVGRGTRTMAANDSLGVRPNLRVGCVIRTGSASPYHGIRAIGGRARDGTPWRLSEEAAIAAIENGQAGFYVERPPGHRIDLVVAQGLGKTYLKSEADGDRPDVLLALPDCDPGA